MGGVGDVGAGVLARAGALVSARRHDDALRLLGPYLASRPDDVDALCLAAEASLQLDRFDRAVELAGRAGSLAPDDVRPFLLTARIHLGAERVSEAIPYAVRAVQIDPQSAYPHFVLGHVLIRDRPWASETAAAVGEAVRLGPNDPAVHVLAGDLHRNRKDPAKADAAYRQALRLDPQNPSAHHQLAVLAATQGEIAAAAVGFRDVLASNPQHATGLDNLELLLGRLLLRADFVLLAALLVQAQVAGFGWVSSLAATAILVGSGRYYRRQFGSRTALVICGIFRRSPGLPVTVGLSAAVFGLIWARGFDIGLSATVPGLWGLLVSAWILIAYRVSRGEVRFRQPRG